MSRKWISIMLCLAMAGGLLFGWAPQRAAAVETEVTGNEELLADPDTVTVELKSSGGDPLAGAAVSYYDAGWHTFGTTDAAGVATKTLPDKSYTFHIEYEGTAQDKTQHTGTDPLVAFQTVNAKVRLKDSLGNPLSGGTASYYGTGGWKPFGSIAGGEVAKELLPGNYTYSVSYEGTSASKAQNTGTDPVVAFQTVKAKVQLKDSQGNPLSDATASYYGSEGWKSFGSVTGGEASKELLPGSYTFHVDYEGTKSDKTQQIGTDPVVVFQTVKAVVQLKNQQGYPLSGGVVSYYGANSWQTFGTTVGGTASKQLLPGSYTFAMNYGGASSQQTSDLAANPTVPFQVQALFNLAVAPKQSGQYDPIPVPPADRPRVLVNDQTLPALKTRLQGTAFNAAWTRVNAKAQISKTGSFPARTGTAVSNIDAETVEVMKANAIRYLIFDDQAAGEKAVDLAVNMANTAQWNPDRTNGTMVFNVGRVIGNLMFFESLVYDWCYDLMSAGEREDVREALDAWVRNGLEYNYPLNPADKRIIAGHANGDVHHQYKLAMAIALYDTNPEYYDDIADFLLNVTLPGFNVMFDAEMAFEGPAYGDNRIRYVMMGNELWKAIGVHPLTDKVGLALDRWVYTRRSDGYIMTEGDDFNTDYQYAWNRFNQGNLTSLIAGSVYNNPRAQNEYLRQTIEDDFYYLLFFNPAAASQSVYDTPLSRYFPAPYGSIVARTGWDEGQDSKAVVAVMNIGERTQTNHQHTDAGAFSMYYKGYLAVDSGIYSGKDPVTNAALEYGSDHSQQYFRQSMAHNVVQIKDPLATTQGTFSPSNQLFVTQIPSSVEQWNTDPKYQRGDILSHAIGDDAMHPDYSYVKGELGEAYGTRTDHYTRSMAFLNLKDDKHPAAMIVYDNIDTPNANAEKKWLLHTVGEPVIAGGRYTNEVTQRSYNGKLVTDTLLPKSDDLQVEKVGGPGHEFDVDGVNKAIVPTDASDIATVDAGKWRLEISSETAANQTQFLNVMQVMDAVDGPAPLDVHYSETADYAGARIQDRVVFFAKDFDLVGQQATIAFDGSTGQTYKILVADLEAGYWTVVKQGGPAATAKYQAVQEGNTIYFEGTPGTYTLQKADASALPLAAKVPSVPVERKVRVRVDAQGLNLAVSPQLVNGTPMVPAKGVLEELGMTFAWNSTTNTATATQGTKTVQFVTGSTTAKINGQNATMTAAATGTNEQMLIPAAFIANILNFTVTWKSPDQVVEIVSKAPANPPQYQQVALAPVTPIPMADLKEIKYKRFRTSYVPTNIWKLFDDDFANISRWSGDSGSQIVFDFGTSIDLERVDIAPHNYAQTRTNRFMLSVSQDGENWTNVYGGDTVGDAGAFIPFNLPSLNCRYLRVAVFGTITPSAANPTFVSFSEMKFYVEK
ncbi:stalk domain-containing protein [Cohnella sp. JJ-181]|uniref:stalk domain-containing protein n=1 Tax=Cohnella rhizoplanae TaxID=2974897 RepID=UPI00232C192A|nr:stalk domain-containing protein [Cohnella sp. JJ-181]